jgi:hypothetical protein
MLSLSGNEIAYFCFITVFAYSLRGATGFGAAAPVPLMGLVVPVKVLVPAWTVLSLFGSVPQHCLGRPDAAAAELHAGHRDRAFFLRGARFPHARASAWRGDTPPRRPFALGLNAGPPPGPRRSLWRDARLAGLLGGTIGTTMGALSSLFFAMYFDAIGMPKNYFRATLSMAVVAIAFVRGLGYLAIGGYSRDVLLRYWRSRFL